MIQVRDLRVVRGGRTLLDIDALDITEGAVTAVIGPSGAGKTTFLRAFCMIDEPKTGSLNINGRHFQFPRSPESDLYVPRPWPDLTAVFQELWLWDHLDLETNIRLPTRSNLGAVADDRFACLIAELDLDHLIHRFPHQVSGGERQRAAIARAMMQRPKVLLLDEPTSASDVEHSHQLAELIRRRATAESMTVLLVTHHLGFADRVSDHVVFLEGGRVLKVGPIGLLKHADDARIRRFVSVL